MAAAGIALWGAVHAGAQRTDLPEAPPPALESAGPKTESAPPPWRRTTYFDAMVEPRQPDTQPAAWGWKAWSHRLPRAAGETQEEADGAPYHWRGLIWQTVAFNLAENGFRLSSDHVMRDDMAHKPFWHDYIAATKQFNMRRWNDGDSFIVNYIGHAMHGGVASYLEIQNSPEDARLEWGDPGYARSRFKGFLWATMFSAHSEISPAGEAGVGDEGAFTYGVNCQYHCNSSNFKPGDHYTNNTGWVDFIVSPTVGTVWVVTEDVIDRYVNEWLIANHPGRFWPYAVRGTLNPSRSFANMLRWRSPWYRDFEHPAPEPQRVHWFPAEDEAHWRALPAVQMAPFYSRFSVASNTAACFNCRATATGGGVQGAFQIHDWLYFDTALSRYPGASPLPSDRAGGDMTMAVFGLGAMRQWHFYSFRAALRPGFVRFNRAYQRSPEPVIVTTYPPGIATHGGDADSVPVPGVVDANGTPKEPGLGVIQHFVWDFSVSADWRLTDRLAFRVGIDDVVVRYRTDKVDAPGIGTPPYLSWMSKQNFIMRGNPVLQLGPVLSF